MAVYLWDKNTKRRITFAHAIDASRAVLIRGSGLEAVSGDLLVLVGWAAGIFILGIILFARTMRS